MQSRESPALPSSEDRSIFYRPTSRPLVSIAIAVVIALLSGCASPGVATSQVVRVETPDCDGALCELRNDKGHWTIASTPGTVALTTSSQSLEIMCRAAGSTSAPVAAHSPSAIDERGTKGAVSGGVVGAAAGGAAIAPLAALFTPATFFVVIGALGGAGIGASAGTLVDESSRYLHYPDTISVPLVCRSASPLRPSLAGAPVGIAVRELADSESAALGNARGVIVTRIASESRADRAGLRERDVIVRCNDADVTDVDQLLAIVHANGPGEPFRLLVLRDNRSVEIAVPKMSTGP